MPASTGGPSFYVRNRLSARECGPAPKWDANLTQRGRRHSYEDAAIKAFRSDSQFLDQLRRFGKPWRGVQERLKEELPDLLSDRDKIAYGLVPKAMNAVFGQQETAWKTEKRPAKSGSGYTTWIVVI